MSGRTILHSDCNCFYASVELLHRPELRGKPVAVGGDPEARHGIVLTASYE
ncbi:MAG: DNA polymerase IV, partial [Lachnospiraceae bacterium]|nr:DNA polymerase IV [Lachnospiraceae bacterium]